MSAIAPLLTRSEPTKWVFAGDSITHGALHTIGWRDYTEHFTERVRWELKRTRDVVIKTGISGWTIRHIADDLDWNVLQFKPDCVSINVGMNDCNQGETGLEAFRTTYLETIDRIHEATGAAVLLHTPNGVLPTTNEARLQHLEAYTESVRALAQQTGSLLVDHYAEWQATGMGGGIHSWMSDGCHPNEYGHRVMAFTLFHALGIWDDASLVCRLPVYRV